MIWLWKWNILQNGSWDIWQLLGNYKHSMWYWKSPSVLFKLQCSHWSQRQIIFLIRTKTMTNNEKETLLLVAKDVFFLFSVFSIWKSEKCCSERVQGSRQSKYTKSTWRTSTKDTDYVASFDFHFFGVFSIYSIERFKEIALAPLSTTKMWMNKLNARTIKIPRM